MNVQNEANLSKHICLQLGVTVIGWRPEYTIFCKSCKYQGYFSIYLFLSFLTTANKEASYVWALSLATIAHTVAKACKDYGASLESCSCTEPNQPTEGSQIEFVCSDNFEFGLNFAEDFLTKGFHGIGRKQELDLHNIKAGRLVSTDTVSVFGMCTACIFS